MKNYVYIFISVISVGLLFTSGVLTVNIPAEYYARQSETSYQPTATSEVVTPTPTNTPVPHVQTVSEPSKTPEEIARDTIQIKPDEAKPGDIAIFGDQAYTILDGGYSLMFGDKTGRSVIVTPDLTEADTILRVKESEAPKEGDPNFIGPVRPETKTTPKPATEASQYVSQPNASQPNASQPTASQPTAKPIAPQQTAKPVQVVQPTAKPVETAKPVTIVQQTSQPTANPTQAPESTDAPRPGDADFIGPVMKDLPPMDTKDIKSILGAIKLP